MIENRTKVIEVRIPLRTQPLSKLKQQGRAHRGSCRTKSLPILFRIQARANIVRHKREDVKDEEGVYNTPDPNLILSFDTNYLVTLARKLLR